jgi:hypothetical protein
LVIALHSQIQACPNFSLQVLRARRIALRLLMTDRSREERVSSVIISDNSTGVKRVG